MPPQQFPSVEISLALAPDELAGFLLAYLRDNPDGVPRHHRGNILGRLSELGGKDFGEACAESWAWLERAGLLIYSITARNDGVFELSRSAKALKTPDALAAHRQASAFSRALLHPTVADEAYGLYLVGKFDLAVFAAFRAVEDYVRQKSGCGDDGAELMRAAFNGNTGPLRDTAAQSAEQHATANLFAGAFGIFRNPPGHRKVAYGDPAEPAAQISLASQLMRMAEAAPKLA